MTSALAERSPAGDLDGRKPLHSAIEKADVLIEALEWIRNSATRSRSSSSAAASWKTPMRCGTCCSTSCSWRPSACGRSSSTAAAPRSAGPWPRPGWSRIFIQGRRYTDDATLRHRRTGAGLRNQRAHLPTASKSWAAARRRSISARTNVLFGERMHAARRRRPADRPGACRPRHARRPHHDRQPCYAGIVPVIPSMCLDRQRREAERQRRHGGHGRGPGAGGRKAGLSQRRQRRAPRTRTIPTRSSTRSPPTKPAS